MLKVQCTGCQSAYEIEERRIPASGLKMRCTKCGTSLRVELPNAGASASASTDAMLPSVRDARRGEAKAPAPAAPKHKQTEGYSLDLDWGRAELPSSLARSTSEGPRVEDADIDLQDLPAVLRGALTLPDRAAQTAKSMPSAGQATLPQLDLNSLGVDNDLPAVSSGRADRKDDDLPAARASAPRRDAAGPGAAARRETVISRLPKPVGPQGAELPAIRMELAADSPARSERAGFGELDLPLLAPEPPVLSNPVPAVLDPALPSVRGQGAAPAAVPPRPAMHAASPSAAAPRSPSLGTVPISLPPLEMPISTPGSAPKQSLGAVPISLPPLEMPISTPGSAPKRSLGAVPIEEEQGPEGKKDWLSLPPEPDLSGASTQTQSSELSLATDRVSKPPRVPQTASAKTFGEIDLSSSEQPISFEELDFDDPAPGPSEHATSRRSGALGSVPPLLEPGSAGGAKAKSAKPSPSQPAHQDIVDLTAEASLSSAPPPTASVSSAPPPDGDDMEFGAIPQVTGAEGTSLETVPASLPKAPQPFVPDPRVAEKPRRPRTRLMFAGLAGLLLVAAGSLEVVSPYGAFGRHVLSDLINADRYRALQASTLDTAKRLMAADVYSDAMRAVSVSELAYAQAPRVHALLAYGAFLGYMTELRFGRNAGTEAHSHQELATLSEDKSSLYLDLARIAQAAVGSQIPRARQLIDTLEQRYPRDPDVTLLSAEIALVAKDPQKAASEFQKAEQILGPSARTAYGNARALWASGDEARALQAARAAVERSPNHAAARVLLAKALWSKGDEAGAMTALAQLTGPGAVREAASSMELVDALTVMSRVHMARSRMSQAEAVLAEALRIDPKSGASLAGMGEVLYREGRFTESLAKFEAGIQADPEGAQAKIGSAKAKIALERIQEAKDQLKKLRDARQNDPEVDLWLGRTEEALGDRDSAAKSYQEAMLVGGSKPEIVDSYVALARLLVTEGRNSDADAVLAEARRKLPPSPSVHRGLGSVHLQAGRFEAAKAEFESALKQDPDDLAARFELATTLRRMGKFDQATAEFDRLGASDPQYPGLALERGLLYEAGSHLREALDFYQQALSKAPDDPDLMLRVGSAEVGSGHAGQAEEMLRKVILKRPNSAEVNHYLGRALLLKGTNLAEALRYLKRAAEIDPNRAEYHLYVGWAANEAGQPAVAREELDKALELDKGLADAYWQKGELLRKQSAIVDAMRFAEKALELRPTRYEAYATMAQCYQDQNRTGDAIAAWKKAISADENVPEWHYRLGKLLGRGGEAELDKAVKLAELVDTKPGWLAQAYFELAEIEQGSAKRSEAIEHFRHFLSSAKADSPYRADAKRALAALGAPYED